MQSARLSLACFQTRSGRRIPEKTAEKPAERKPKQKNPVAAEIAATHVMIVIAVTAVIPVMTDVILAETAPAVPAVRSRGDSADSTEIQGRRKTLPGITLSRVIFFVPYCSICG